LLADDISLERRYLQSLSNGGPTDTCNRTYHRVYYGDESYRSPATFLEDNCQIGKDDWCKTRGAILMRFSSINPRALKLRGLDIVTFRRLYETRQVPKLGEKEMRIINNCTTALNSLPPEKARIISDEHHQLIETISQINPSGVE
jgi:hypothetical protein